MKFGLAAIPAVALALAGATPALAQEAKSNSFQHVAILQGDYAAAERRLTAAARDNPDMPEILLNLAVIMVRTGRYAQARDFYLRVLRNDDVELALSNGDVQTAHDIARRGISLIKTATTQP